MTASLDRRRILNAVLLAAGGATVFSGLLVQIHFHMHHAAGAVWGLDHAAWNMVHQAVSFTFLGAVVWHLAIHWRAFLAYCRSRGAWRRLGFYLTVAFGLAVITALGAWVAFLAFNDAATENTLVEIHDKATIPLSALLVAHGWRRRWRLFRRT